MLIDGNRIYLDSGEAFCTLFQKDAFFVEAGRADVYIIRHTQAGRSERRVCVMRAAEKCAIPSFSAEDNVGEVWCFAIVAADEPVCLSRMEKTKSLTDAFMASARVYGYEHEGFEASLIHSYIGWTPEDGGADVVEIAEGQVFYAEENGRSYYVESGAVNVYIEPSAEGEGTGRRLFLLRAAPEDDFALPGMRHASGGREWRLAAVPAGGEARLRRMPCTRVAQEKFLAAVQESSEAPLMEIYGHEGFAESLVQYYTSKNDLADIIRESMQEQNRESISRDTDEAILKGMGEKQAAPVRDRGSRVCQALAYLCRRGGIDIPREEEWAERCAGMKLPDMAAAAGVICREVVLEEGWHWSDCGLLLCKMEKRPVACYPGDFGGYRYYDPSTGREEKLGGAAAEKIARRAYSIRRSLPEGSLTFGDIARFVLAGVHKGDAAGAALLGALCLLISMIMPALNAAVYDACIPAGDSSMLLQLCLITGAFMLGGAGFSLVRNLYEYRIAARAGYELQDAMYARVFAMPESFMRQYDSGDLARRVQSFGSMASRLVTKAITAAACVLFSAAYLLQMAGFSGYLTLLAALMLIPYSGAIWGLSVMAARHERTAAVRENESVSRLQQFLAGIQKIRMAGVEEKAILEYIKPIAGQQQAGIRAGRLTALGDALKDAGGMLFLAVFYGAIIRRRMDISVGTLIAFCTSFALLLSAVRQLTGELVHYRFMKAKIALLRPLLACGTESDSGGEEPVVQLKGRITLEHVTFSYEKNSAAVLRDISLDIRPGEYVGIVGRSGCGKSTILKLLLGFETPDSGRVLFDGRDAAKLDQHALRRRLGAVLQGGSLIAGSIYENIVVTMKSPSREAAETAARRAGLERDIGLMPMGMDTVISESAGTISGGQKQRILIARAIAGEPDVLLFDEATSALDNRTQDIVCRSLEKMSITRVVVAHRLSTIERCDRIIVLDGGRIAEEGSYAQLIEKRGLFYEMAKRQIAGD